MFLSFFIEYGMQLNNVLNGLDSVGVCVCMCVCVCVCVCVCARLSVCVCMCVLCSITL